MLADAFYKHMVQSFIAKEKAATKIQAFFRGRPIAIAYKQFKKRKELGLELQASGEEVVKMGQQLGNNTLIESGTKVQEESEVLLKEAKESFFNKVKFQ